MSASAEHLEGSNDDREDLRQAPRSFGEQTWGAYLHHADRI